MLYFGIVGHLGIKCCHCELRLTILYMFELSKYLFIFRNMLMSINYAHREDRFGAMASFIPPRSHSNLPNEVMLVRSANATFNGHNIDYHWNFIPHHLQACWGFTFLLRSNALKIWFSTLAIEFGVSLEWATIDGLDVNEIRWMRLPQFLLTPINYLGHFSIITKVTNINPLHSTHAHG